MSINETDFLKEDDFIEVMNSENKKWRDVCVKNGTLKASDGTVLNYYSAVPENPKAVVVMVHGFCEFWGKYHEYAWYLYRAGFAVYFMEQRGFGYSEGKVREWDLVYIDDYDTYVEDLKAFLDEKVVPENPGLKKFLLAHSMGGAVSTLFLEKYQDFFELAVLSTPMLKLKSAISPIVAGIMGIWARIHKREKHIAPGQTGFSAEPDFENSCSLSRARFDYVHQMRVSDVHYQTSAPTIGWALASFKTHKRIMEGADKIRIPVTVFTAGDDDLIDDEGYRIFAEKAKRVVVIHCENSKHEIFNAGDEERIGYFKKVLEIFENGAENSA